MKKLITIIVFGLLLSSNCYSQVILRKSDYLIPIRDSVKLYRYPCDFRGSFRRYLYKSDTIPYEGKTVECSSRLDTNYQVRSGGQFSYLIPKDVRFNSHRDTLTKTDLVNLLKLDSITYRPPSYYNEGFNNGKPVYDFENFISNFKSYYDIIGDDEMMNLLFCDFYDLQSLFIIKNIRIKNGKKNNIPLCFIVADVKQNNIGNPEIRLKVKNISNQDIDAFDITIYCYNRYGNPVNKYSTGSNICAATSQDLIKKGEESSGTWTLFGQELTTNVKVFLSKVHFTNGKTVVIPNKQITKIEGKLE